MAKNESQLFYSDSESEQAKRVNTTNPLPVLLYGADGSAISVQHPLPTDGDSVYVKDIWLEESDQGNFDGVLTDLFDNLHSQIVNDTINDPKEITIHFNRTIVSNAIGLGNASTGNFSNVKIQLKNSGGILTTVIDESAVDTKYTTRTFQLPVTAGFNALVISFHTEDTISLSNCVILKTRSVISRGQAVKPDGTVVDLNATTGGNQKFSLEEFDETFNSNPLPVVSYAFKIAQGLATGVSYVNKFGQNNDIGTADYEDIWDSGGEYVYPDDNTAPITKLVGHDAADTQLIEVQGLDIDGVLVVQTKTITGLTAVTLDTPLWRVFRLKNIGTEDLVADVCAINDDDSIDYACINNGNNQTLMALYTVPAGKTGYMYESGASMAGLVRAYSIDGGMWMREFGKVFQLKGTVGLNSDGSSRVSKTYQVPVKIAEKTDIRMSAISSSNGGVMNATFDLMLVDD